VTDSRRNVEKNILSDCDDIYGEKVRKIDVIGFAELCEIF
jgi:hypothetical protein